MHPYQKTFIELAIAHKALRFGEFTLKSGRISPYFFNMGELHTGQALQIVGECYAQAIHHSALHFDVLFGPAYKGIPLVCTTAIALTSQFQRSLPYTFNRKEAKDHGEGGQLVGAPLQGRVLIIDDVITAGTALREAITLIQASAHVAGIFVALDRQEKGQSERSALQEIQATLAVPVQSIITFADVLSFVADDPQYKIFETPLQVYRNQYGPPENQKGF